MIAELLQEWWIKPVAVLVIVLTLCPATLAQEKEHDPCGQAEVDAAKEVNSLLWFVAGCLGGIIGLILSYAITPSPPAARLIGKSPEYVATYTDCYRSKGKSTQGKYALMGCATQALVYGVYIVLVVVAASEE